MYINILEIVLAVFDIFIKIKTSLFLDEVDDLHTLEYFQYRFLTPSNPAISRINELTELFSSGTIGDPGVV